MLSLDNRIRRNSGPIKSRIDIWTEPGQLTSARHDDPHLLAALSYTYHVE